MLLTLVYGLPLKNSLQNLGLVDILHGDLQDVLANNDENIIKMRWEPPTTGTEAHSIAAVPTEDSPMVENMVPTNTATKLASSS